MARIAVRPGNRIQYGPYEAHDGFARLTASLSIAYVAGVSGVCALWRVRRPQTATLSAIYCNIQLNSGAGAASLTVQVRTGTVAAPDMSGGGLLQSVVYVPGGVLGWHRVPGFTTVLTANTVYWIVIGDTVTTGAAWSQLNTGNTFLVSSHVEQHHDLLPGQSADGGQTPVMSGSAPGLVLVFADGGVMGWPLAQETGGPNNALQKGNRILFTRDVKIIGFAFANPSNLVSGVRVWQGSTGPAGSPTAEATIACANAAVSSIITGYLFLTPFTFAANVAYRVVCAYSGAATEPRQTQISTGTDATLRAAMPYGGDWYWTEESAGAWVDDQNALARIQLLGDEFPTPAVARSPLVCLSAFGPAPCPQEC